MENIKSYDELINESKKSEWNGIHPAVRKTLFAYLEKNPGAKYSHAKKHVASEMKGWDLSIEDFDEAKATIKAGKDHEEKKAKEEAKEEKKKD